jgi:hypothetical protein
MVKYGLLVSLRQADGMFAVVSGRIQSKFFSNFFGLPFIFLPDQGKGHP